MNLPKTAGAMTAYAVIAAGLAAILSLTGHLHAPHFPSDTTTIVVEMGDGVCETVQAKPGTTVHTWKPGGKVGPCSQLPAGVCVVVDAWRQLIPCDASRTACGDDGTRVYSIDSCQPGDVPFAMWCAGLEEWRILHGLDQLGIPQHAACRPKGTS